VSTGIKGLDEILGGGLPQGRTTLVCGGPGCGKTLLASEFLVRGAEQSGEPGVFMAFEETAEELTKNVASLGFDLNRLIEQNKIFVDYVRIERSEIEETGEYDLEGLFIRLASAIDSVGAKRVVLDTIETIFAGFADDAILRSEIRRLFRWMKDKGVTAIVTGERGENSLTRYGLEEYVSDCVILLDNRIENKISKRIMRVVKYRGSGHGTDEYPFLIGNQGLWVQPITSLGLDYTVTNEHISTGVAELDNMLNGQGYFRGSSVLISGSAGTGKTSLAATLVDAACRRGERCLYFAFEEAPAQILRNMRSISIDLEPWVERGLLYFRAARPSFYGLEMHLLTIQKLVDEFDPQVVVIDPLTNLISIGSNPEVKSMLVRLIDYLKMKQVTTLFTSLTAGGQEEITSEIGVSSLMDTWLLVRNLEKDGERNRGLYVLKSRGMAHSTQVREFCLSERGVDLVDVYIGPDGVITGSARIAQEAREQAKFSQRQAEIERKQRELERKRKVIESQMAVLQAEIESAEEQLRLELIQAEETRKNQADELQALAQARQGNGSAQSRRG
ncbi:MAG: circadian clock protein KaiC, partial [Chloroflexi bacterium]